MRTIIRAQLGPDSGLSENLSQRLMRTRFRRLREQSQKKSEDESQALVRTKVRQ